MTELEKDIVREFVKEARDKYPDALEAVAVFHTNVRKDASGGFHSRQYLPRFDELEHFLTKPPDCDFTGVVMRTDKHFPMGFSYAPAETRIERFSLLFGVVQTLAERAGVRPLDIETVTQDLAKAIKQKRETWIN